MVTGWPERRDASLPRQSDEGPGSVDDVEPARNIERVGCVMAAGRCGAGMSWLVLELFSLLLIDVMAGYLCVQPRGLLCSAILFSVMNDCERCDLFQAEVKTM